MQGIIEPLFKYKKGLFEKILFDFFVEQGNRFFELLNIVTDFVNFF